MTLKPPPEFKIPPAKVLFPDDVLPRTLDMISKSIASGALTLGPHGREFEAVFAKAHGAEADCAVTTSSGTSALEILIRTLNIQGKKIIMPANTFAATAFAVIHAGCIPVLADMEPVGMGLSPASAEACLDPDVGAVLTVHIAGCISPEIWDLVSLCRKHSLPLIEDAAHAHGAYLLTPPARRWYAGSFDAGAAFSFYPTKVITAGEGGMILTCGEAAKRARGFRDQGKMDFNSNFHTEMGSNWRMNEMCAALGLNHTRHLAEVVANRAWSFSVYAQLLADAQDSLNLPQEKRVVMHPAMEREGNCYYKIIAILPRGVDRGQFKELVKSEGVRLAGEVYDLPLYKQPVFEDVARANDLPHTDDFCARHICLPVWWKMVRADIQTVCGAVAEAALEVSK